MIQLWMILVAIALIFVIAVKLMVLRSLFKTKVLQWAKHQKALMKPEAAWVWKITLVLTLVIGVGEFAKAGNPLLITELVIMNYVGLALLVLGLWVLAAAMDARRQYLWFWQVLGPKETIPPFSKNGIYGSVRNPRELGVILVLGGLAIALGLNFTVAFVVLFLFATMYRVSSRDRILIEKHGKTYIDYTRSTKKLIPYIY